LSKSSIVRIVQIQIQIQASIASADEIENKSYHIAKEWFKPAALKLGVATLFILGLPNLKICSPNKIHKI
jgi:hypothetical protein